MMSSIKMVRNGKLLKSESKIFNVANKEHKCEGCKKIIKIGKYYLYQEGFSYKLRKACIKCVEKELKKIARRSGSN